MKPKHSTLTVDRHTEYTEDGYRVKTLTIKRFKKLKPRANKKGQPPQN